MKKENDEMFDLFRSKLEDTRIPVRQNLWNSIEKEVITAAHRRRQFFHRIAGAASVLLVLAGASAAFWYYSPKDEISKAFNQVAITTSKQATIENDGVKEEFPSIRPVHVLSPPASSSDATYRGEDDDEMVIFSASVDVSFSVRHFETMRNDGGTHAAGMDDESSFYEPEEPFTVVPAIEKKAGKWLIGVIASGSFLSAGNQAKGLQNFLKEKHLARDGHKYHSQIATTIPEGEQFSRVKHKNPFQAGATVQRKLTDRFALGTGLVYTQLNSELSAGTTHSFYSQNQKLHYLGIPVKAEYSLYETNHMNLFASAGGMVEKCIAGRVRTNYYIDGEKIQSTRNSVTPDQLQLSLFASAGVEYKINNRFSVYAEPGISYHFDDGSSVNTIRKEKPLNVNLLCGVKLTY